MAGWHTAGELEAWSTPSSLKKRMRDGEEPLIGRRVRLLVAKRKGPDGYLIPVGTSGNIQALATLPEDEAAPVAVTWEGEEGSDWHSANDFEAWSTPPKAPEKTARAEALEARIHIAWACVKAALACTHRSAHGGPVPCACPDCGSFWTGTVSEGHWQLPRFLAAIQALEPPTSGNP